MLKNPMTSSTRSQDAALRKEDASELSNIQADYLELIYEEFLESGSARGCTIAQAANVTRATVTAAMRSLKTLGYIHYEPYGPIALTEKGKEEAKRLRERRLVLEAFFKDIFGTDPVVARKLADMNKHGAPEKMVRSLRRLTAFINAHQKEWQEWPSD